ncbi:iron complex transport system permease protein [Tissierella praeacuta DSM 18095]|uniref:Iron complex transport system permease protein n=1 Tax=Tissierella praeacuta DSM 18095 TaxID=1123404 RepID=A0A1M4XFZ7_9FIRM|nr:iron ABC transporter permease [Tissierella praeacuta]TCU67776.1 iron complex transport system permease protein [Tissierella praeacuta]SHE92112.1 iron complex transport system permease protein [Tissierella praeacuta DSM 18095]SUP02191.1 Probable ABC transporter permease protein HI_1471 [Tissierella praeacuta]
MKLFYVFSCILALLLLYISIVIGRFEVSTSNIISLIKRENLPQHVEKVILSIRLPRFILSLIVGAGLSISGAAFQSMFQNRLASPDILGVSNGAAFGAAFAILFFSGSTKALIVTAFIFGIVAVVLTYTISQIQKSRQTITLILSGIIVGSFFSALLSFLKLVADTDQALPAITYWLMGSFIGASFYKIIVAGIPILFGTVILIMMRFRLNILSLGDDEAFYLGINPRNNRFIIIFACTLISASCVMVSGIIGWVGMIVPNLMRQFFGADNKNLIPSSAIFGGIFMVVMDLLARSISEADIPIGILTAIVGAPIFVLVFKRFDGGGK